MKTPSRAPNVWLSLCAGFLLLAGQSHVLAQPPASPGSLTNQTAVSQVPPIPKLKSPVARFRELLMMAATDRRLILTNRTAEVRDKLVAKIREYNALTAEVREARLTATEFRWYLVKLMSLAPTNRSHLLDSVPENLMPLVESRLAQWDLLPPELQRQILINEQAISLMTHMGTNSTGAARQSLEGLPAAQRLSMQVKLARIDGMADAERVQAFSLFERFFEMTPEEREKALRTLSETERDEMQRTLQTFEGLPPDKRAQCVRTFERFTNMTPEERGLFLRNAQQWETMSPSERQTWRQIVNTVKIMPPLPYPRRPPLPPSPPVTRALNSAMTTNR